MSAAAPGSDPSSESHHRSSYCHPLRPRTAKRQPLLFNLCQKKSLEISRWRGEKVGTFPLTWSRFYNGKFGAQPERLKVRLWLRSHDMTFTTEEMRRGDRKESLTRMKLNVIADTIWRRFHFPQKCIPNRPQTLGPANIPVGQAMRQLFHENASRFGAAGEKIKSLSSLVRVQLNLSQDLVAW